MLFQAGVPQADLDRVCTKEDKDVLVDATLHRLRPREGLAEMLRVLEEGGVTFVTCSGASVSRVRNYFESVGIDLPSAQIYDSAPIGQHKPEMIVYETVLAEYQAKYPEETLIFSGRSVTQGFDVKRCAKSVNSRPSLGCMRSESSRLQDCVLHGVRGRRG